ncbi:ATP-binding protein [Candidatus Woesearchaeota archaeon]|nr:ATP-binding protein [Candidatus Woesearchaeota archaeon]
MAYDIVIGRSEEDKNKFGKMGTILLGKHYVKMGQVTSLSNEIYLDVARSHVVFVCGKRGSGKSYSMGVIAEGMANLPPEISQNLAVVMLDTMGIYWTMKYANKKEESLLSEWGLEAKPLDVQIYTPVGYFKTFKDEGIPTDFPFSIMVSELSAYDWCLTFDISLSDSVGVLIEKIIEALKKEKEDYSIDDIVNAIESDEKTDQNVKNAAQNRFIAAKSWGIFSKKGTPMSDLVNGGQVTVIDVSCYAVTPGAEGLRALVIGLISQKLFIQRMVSRRMEEFHEIRKRIHYLTEEDKTTKKKSPLVWLVIDEAHEFLPNEGKTAASQALITILREGRQPGISLILASQQPGKIHTDVMTQSDVVIAHEVTAKIDIDALGTLMQSYMREGLDKQLNYLPKVNGAAIVFDDMNERLYPMRIRPRFTWHGGEAPIAIVEKKKIFDF